jgi:hypothetical protein
MSSTAFDDQFAHEPDLEEECRQARGRASNVWNTQLQDEVMELLCSAHEIASREGVNTNWVAFLSSVKQVLKKCNRTGVTARTYRQIDIEVKK